MANVDLLLSTGEGLTRLLSPLERALANEESFAALLERLGWDVNPADLDITAIHAAVGVTEDLTTAAQRLGEIVSASGEVPVDKYVELVEMVTSIVAALRDLPGTPPPDGIPAPAWETFCGELLDELVVTYIEATVPGVLALLLLGGVVNEQEVQANGVANRVPYVRRELRWDRLGTLVSDPVQLARDLYGWGDAGQTSKLPALLARTARAMDLLGLPAQLALPSATWLNTFYAPDSPYRTSARELLLSLIEAGDEHGNALDATLSVLPIPAETDRGGPPRGIVVAPTVEVTGTPPVATFWPFSLELKGPQAAYSGARLEMFPGSARIDLGPAAAVTVEALARLRHDVPRTILGSIFSTRLDLHDIALVLSINGELTDPDITLELEVEKAVLVVDFSEGDGFLEQVLSTGIKPIELSLALAWSSKSGLHIRAGGALDIVIPLNARLGVVEIDSLTVRGEASSTRGLAVAGGLSGSLALGPVQASIQNVGAKVSFVPVPQGQPAGTFGDVDVQSGFKPPSGAGLSIDAGAVTGGGFLFFDPEREQYAGGMHLEVEGGITLNAIGLLTTRMPDGTRGFSLLVIVQASGFAPIQLGFGFTLNGVGGLLGINRTVATEVLRAGIRNRSLDAILFSQDDPTPRAPQIVSTLQSVFPPARDRYVFGPMALIGWGTPTVLTIEVALVLELPAPIRLMVLGRLRAALPKPEAALVTINMDAFGLIDFERREASIDATLYDSNVGPFALTGDMVLRAVWGDQPAFLLSIGGFHPAFSPPPGVPALRRLAIALSTGNNPRLRAEAYLAITSNTVQIGAGLEFYVEAMGFNLSGGFGFDALLQLSPFRFQVDIRAYLALRRGRTTLAGLDVLVHLDGPTPWHAAGQATIRILFVSVTVQFEATFGDPAEIPPRERVPIWDLLEPELQNTRNWTAQLPEDAGRLAAFRDGGAGDPLVHPLGTASVSQRIVPLNRDITRFGAAEPAGPRRFEISRCEGLVVKEPNFEYFAPAQFFTMSDAEKLSSPSFDRMPSGTRIEASGGAVACGAAKVAQMAYDVEVVDDEDRLPQDPPSPYAPSAGALSSLAEIGPAANAEVRSTGRARFRPPGDPLIKVAEEAYAVTETEDLATVPGIETDGSYTGALEALREEVGGDVRKADRFQVVRAEEVALV